MPTGIYSIKLRGYWRPPPKLIYQVHSWSPWVMPSCCLCLVSWHWQSSAFLPLIHRKVVFFTISLNCCTKLQRHVTGTQVASENHTFSVHCALVWHSSSTVGRTNLLPQRGMSQGSTLLWLACGNTSFFCQVWVVLLSARRLQLFCNIYCYLHLLCPHLLPIFFSTYKCNRS